MLSLLSLVLVGCGSNISSPFSANGVVGDETQSFKIAGSTWEVNLPTGWERIAPPTGNTEVIYLARNGTQNFSITYQLGVPENPVEALLTQAKKGFFIFEEKSRAEDQWQFQAKLEITSPLRDFWQKISLVPETEDFLLLSCSQEVAFETTDCGDILDSFLILAD
jgi:hypothetical protein